VSKNHRSTAAKVITELNIQLKDPVSTKTVCPELQKSNMRGKAAIAKTLITKNNAERRKKRWNDD